MFDTAIQVEIDNEVTANWSDEEGTQTRYTDMSEDKGTGVDSQSTTVSVWNQENTPLSDESYNDTTDEGTPYCSISDDETEFDYFVGVKMKVSAIQEILE